MQEEKKRSYVILRLDGLLLHTKPVTEREADWLYRYAYSAPFVDRESEVRYLSEWGNVIDVYDYLERLWRLERDLYYNITGVYEDPGEFEESAGRLLRRGDLQPGARQVIEELLGKARDFLARPVEPKPITAPVRYYESLNLLVAPGLHGIIKVRPERLPYSRIDRSLDFYGIGVFRGSLWLWGREVTVTERNMAVIVRMDVDDRELVAAVANDGAVRGFLRWNADAFRELLRESEDELIDNGYEDVVRKVKVMLTTLSLLSAGRREEALPA